MHISILKCKCKYEHVQRFLSQFQDMYDKLQNKLKKTQTVSNNSTNSFIFNYIFDS